MENDGIRDDFLRDLVRKKEKETLSPDFTSRVMGRIKMESSSANEPLLQPWVWISLAAAFVIFVIVIFTVDVPFVNSLFSATGMEKISLNIFSAQFFSSFSNFFKGIHLTSITIMIVVAAGVLLIIDRLLRHRQPSSKLLII